MFGNWCANTENLMKVVCEAGRKRRPTDNVTGTLNQLIPEIDASLTYVKTVAGNSQ